MLLDDFARCIGGLGTDAAVPGAAAAVEVIDACASNAAIDPVEWGLCSYHLGRFEGVARPEECSEELRMLDALLEEVWEYLGRP